MRNYKLTFENLKTGKVYDIGLKPMTLRQAIITHSKYTDYAWRLIHIVEV